MFVLHPTSRCDVCLEAFSSEQEMAPHAIPCGHVFCKRYVVLYWCSSPTQHLLPSTFPNYSSTPPPNLLLSTSHHTTATYIDASNPSSLPNARCAARTSTPPDSRSCTLIALKVLRIREKVIFSNGLRWHSSHPRRPGASFL